MLCLLLEVTVFFHAGFYTGLFQGTGKGWEGECGFIQDSFRGLGRGSVVLYRTLLGGWEGVGGGAWFYTGLFARGWEGEGGGAWFYTGLFQGAGKREGERGLKLFLFLVPPCKMFERNDASFDEMLDVFNRRQYSLQYLLNYLTFWGGGGGCEQKITEHSRDISMGVRDFLVL